MGTPTFLDPIVNAPRGQKLAFATMLAVFLALGAYYFVVAPEQARVAALESQRKSLELEVLQARTAIADLARFRRETVELERRLETIRENLPTEREIPPLFRTIYEAAAKAGLTVALFQPKEPRIHDYYTEIPIALTAEGSYHQIGEFFESVAAFPRVVTVGDVKISGLGRGRHPVRAEMTLATYVYRPVGSPPAPKPGAVKPSPAPRPQADAPPAAPKAS